MEKEKYYRYLKPQHYEVFDDIISVPMLVLEKMKKALKEEFQ